MTPALDALLKEVEARELVRREPTDVDPVGAWARTHKAEFDNADAAPRLAAMLRVAVEALAVTPTTHAGWKWSQAALARIEALAKGGA